MKSPFYPFLIFGAVLLVMLPACDFYNPFNQYQEDHRPQYHFSIPKGWLGVPAGMVYFKGRYHVFYQQNGADSEPGRMNWGHAVSKDLVHWEHWSAALHDEDKSLFPGSVVVDWDNTTGFGSGWDPVLVAIYTARENDEQHLHLAFSSDNGRRWNQYEGNPVFYNSLKLADPNVFWHHDSGKWVMVAADQDEQKVRLFTSVDLKDWKETDEFSSDIESDGRWQNPGMFPLNVDGNTSNVKWVLHMSTEKGAPAGGGGTQYVIGDFDGEDFQNDSPQDSIRWVDHGPDFYAPKTFTNIPGSDNRRIWMGWMNNHAYAKNIKTDPWRGSLTFPREVMLRTVDEEVQLVQLPIVELRSLRTNRHRFRNRNLTEESNFLRETGITGTSAALIAEFDMGDAEQLGFEVRRGERERTIVAYDRIKEELYIDRTNSGRIDFDTTFSGKYSARLKPKDGRIKMRIFIDRSSVEVFGNEGETVISTQIYPSAESEGMALYVRSGEARLISLDVWELQSIW